MNQTQGRTPPTPLRVLTRNQIFYEERRAGRPMASAWPLPIILLELAGVGYNGLLAFVNARGIYIGLRLVVLTEIVILTGALVTVLAYRSQRMDPTPVLFLAFFLVNAATVSLLSGAVFVDLARNAAIIALFLMLGSQTSPSALNKSFLIASALAFAVLMIEIVSVESYATLFSPASYFANTRGLSPSEFDDIGLFGNALGWDERFSILKLIDHRAASIFLEQVSFANFSVVLTIFLCCRWRSLGTAFKMSLIFLIGLTVITTASRLAFGLVLIAPLAYWLAPKLNRFVPVIIMPVVVTVALIVTTVQPPTEADNLVGRLGYTIRNLGSLDLATIAGLHAPQAPNFADSGYVYVIVAGSFIAMLVLWSWVGLIAAGRSDDIKRCSLLLNLYVFSNLMVSGTSIFSIKTAALLWLLVGFMREQEKVNHTGQGELAAHMPDQRAALRR